MAKKLEYGIFDKHWNCVLGCREGKECAERCWLKRVIKRLEGSPNAKVREAHKGLVMRMPGGSLDAPKEWPLRWTGEVRLNKSHLLDPLKWSKPATVAAGFHGDWALLPDDALDRIMAVAALCQHHRFFFLTKRPERIFLSEHAIRISADRLTDEPFASERFQWPPPNAWLGFSASTQPEFDERWGHMRRLAQAGWNTFVFLEPLLGPVNIASALGTDRCGYCGHTGGCHCDCPSKRSHFSRCLRWVVLGCEAGPRARPFDEGWARSVREQCVTDGIPFFYKQKPGERGRIECPLLDGVQWVQMPEVGK